MNVDLVTSDEVSSKEATKSENLTECLIEDIVLVELHPGAKYLNPNWQSVLK